MIRPRVNNVQNISYKVRGPPHIPIVVKDKKILAIIDTGADRTLCNVKLVEKIYGSNWKNFMNETQVKLKSASGHKLEVLGEIPMELTFKQLGIIHPVIIVDGDVPPFLLGQDFMINKVTIERGKVFIVEAYPNRHIRAILPIQYHSGQLRVEVTENIDIQPNTIRHISCILAADTENSLDLIDYANQTVFVCQLPESEQLNNQSSVLDAVTTIQARNVLTCLLANESSEPIELKAGDKIGKIEILKSTEHKNEYVSDEPEEYDSINYIHDEEAKTAILIGSETGSMPIPAGYEAKPNDFDAGKAIKEMKMPHLSDTERVKLATVLFKYKEVFSKGPGDFGKTDLMTFKIDTGDAEPIASRYIPIPAAYEDEVRRMLKQMEENKVIEECESPWNSGVVLVKKPDGKLRMCINLKNVNSVTINKTSYPINYQEQSFARLCNGKYFFRIDLSQAYYSIPLDSEEDRGKTAFSALGKQYRFITSPFGAKYLPSKFNRLMANIFKGLEENLFFYFDDAIASCKTFEELLHLLEVVLQRLLKANLRVNFQKTEFCLTSLENIQWLGTVIRDNKLHPDPKKVEAILKMEMPTGKKGMQRFLGAVSYHRRHLPNLSETVAPLYKITPPKAEYKITAEVEKAFREAKNLLSSAEALALPDLNRAFIITCDASDIGIGGVLSQENEQGEERVVAYCSRLFTDNEQKISSCEKELLAILYTVSTFSYYLTNKKFLLRSDAQSLVYLQHFKKLNGKLFRASMFLDEYDYDIQHVSMKRGNIMCIADMLSRAYGAEAPNEPRATYKHLRNPLFEKLSVAESIKRSVLNKAEFAKVADKHMKNFLSTNELKLEPLKIRTPSENEFIAQVTEYEAEYPSYLTSTTSSSWITTIDYSKVNKKNQSFHTETATSGESPSVTEGIHNVLLTESLFTKTAFRQAQREDPVYLPHITKLEQLERGQVYKPYMLKKNILFKRKHKKNGSVETVLAIPKVLVPTLLDRYHSKGPGPHIGRSRMWETLKSSFFWPSMAKDIKDYCSKCVSCQYNMRNPDPQYEMNRADIPKYPNHIVNMDIVGPFPKGYDRSLYILTVQDDFSKYVMTYPLKNKTAEQVAKAFLYGWVMPFGKCKFLRSDEGTDVDSGIIRYLCHSLGIIKIRTPAYSPHANPIERWHGTLNQAIRSWLPDKDKQKEWPAIVPFIAMAYNESKNTVTGYKPVDLFLGGRKNSGLMPPIIPDEDPGMDRYDLLRKLKEGQKVHFELARERLRKARNIRIKKLGKHQEPREYFIGDRVLIKNHQKVNKLSTPYIGPYIVVKVKKNGLYCVRWQDAQELKDQNKVPYRLHNEPDELGRREMRFAHPKDVKLYKGDIEQQPEWDDKLARKFLHNLQMEMPDEVERDADFNASIINSDAESRSSISSITPLSSAWSNRSSHNSPTHTPTGSVRSIHTPSTSVTSESSLHIDIGLGLLNDDEESLDSGSEGDETRYQEGQIRADFRHLVRNEDLPDWIHLEDAELARLSNIMEIYEADEEERNYAWQIYYEAKLDTMASGHDWDPQGTADWFQDWIIETRVREQRGDESLIDFLDLPTGTPELSIPGHPERYAERLTPPENQGSPMLQPYLEDLEQPQLTPDAPVPEPENEEIEIKQEGEEISPIPHQSPFRMTRRQRAAANQELPLLPGLDQFRKPRIDKGKARKQLFADEVRGEEAAIENLPTIAEASQDIIREYKRVKERAAQREKMDALRHSEELLEARKNLFRKELDVRRSRRNQKTIEARIEQAEREEKERVERAIEDAYNSQRNRQANDMLDEIIEGKLAAVLLPTVRLEDIARNPAHITRKYLDQRKDWEQAKRTEQEQEQEKRLQRQQQIEKLKQKRDMLKTPDPPARETGGARPKEHFSPLGKGEPSKLAKSDIKAKRGKEKDSLKAGGTKSKDQDIGKEETINFPSVHDRGGAVVELASNATLQHTSGQVQRGDITSSATTTTIQPTVENVSEKTLSPVGVWVDASAAKSAEVSTDAQIESDESTESQDLFLDVSNKNSSSTATEEEYVDVPLADSTTNSSDTLISDLIAKSKPATPELDKLITTFTEHTQIEDVINDSNISEKHKKMVKDEYHRAIKQHTDALVSMLIQNTALENEIYENYRKLDINPKFLIDFEKEQLKIPYFDVKQTYKSINIPTLQIRQNRKKANQVPDKVTQCLHNMEKVKLHIKRQKTAVKKHITALNTLWFDAQSQKPGETIVTDSSNHVPSKIKSLPNPIIEHSILPDIKPYKSLPWN